jgi:hypothetical protein
MQADTSKITVDELITTLLEFQKDGYGDAPITIRRYDGANFEDEPANVVCMLPYNSREEPARVLID